MASSYPLLKRLAVKTMTLHNWWGFGEHKYYSIYCTLNKSHKCTAHIPYMVKEIGRTVKTWIAKLKFVKNNRTNVNPHSIPYRFHLFTSTLSEHIHTMIVFNKHTFFKILNRTDVNDDCRWGTERRLVVFCRLLQFLNTMIHRFHQRCWSRPVDKKINK